MYFSIDSLRKDIFVFIHIQFYMYIKIVYIYMCVCVCLDNIFSLNTLEEESHSCMKQFV